MERGDHVGIGGLVKSHVTVADLDKSQFAFSDPSALFSSLTECITGENSPMKHAKRASARPGHTAKKPAPVDSVVVVVVQNLVFR